VSSGGGEMKGFVFSITFIIVFSSLLISIPTGLQGVGTEPELIVPVDPRLLVGFDEQTNYSKDDYVMSGVQYVYEYSMVDRDWYASTISLVTPYLRIGQKYTYFLWLGYIDNCRFILDNGTDRGTTLTTTVIDGDAEDGVVRYSLLFESSGNDAGAYVLYWNTTNYDNSSHAWDNDALEIVHGIGISNRASNDVLSLLIGLMFLSLPDVPVLVNLLLATPIWAAVIFFLFWAITRRVPFLGG